jgi:hypothetical protein
MKMILLVPDGVGIRNYIFSSFIRNFIKDGNEVLVYHSISKFAIEEIQMNKSEIRNFKVIPDFKEKFIARLLRESIAYARILINKKKLNNITILKFWSPSKNGFKRKILYFLAEILGVILSNSYSLILKADTLYEKEIVKNKTTELIKKTLLDYQPDIILNLHQRAPSTVPIISSAIELNIKVATVIYSWDNVPKARLISRYDFYFVWSKLMKKELDVLYPEIASSQIHIVGTPQFEFYFQEKYYVDKEFFYDQFGLDIQKKTICFSGNDQASPYEAYYLNDLCEALCKIDQIDRPQIIFRRCPVDKTNRFNQVLKKYSHLIFSIDPDWGGVLGSDSCFSENYPRFNDVSLLVNTLKHSDLVINLGSTMAHDAAILDKPCLYLNYDPVVNSVFKVEDIYNFQHFRSMENLNAVGWINSKEEIHQKIVSALINPLQVGKDRKKWLKKIVLHPIENSSRMLHKKILECISVS